MVEVQEHGAVAKASHLECLTSSFAYGCSRRVHLVESLRAVLPGCPALFKCKLLLWQSFRNPDPTIFDQLRRLVPVLGAARWAIRARRPTPGPLSSLLPGGGSMMAAVWGPVQFSNRASCW